MNVHRDGRVNTRRARRRRSRDAARLAFGVVGLNWEDHVVVGPDLIRPAEVDALCADPKRARQELGWEPEVTFEQFIAMMVEADLAELACPIGPDQPVGSMSVYQ